VSEIDAIRRMAVVSGVDVDALAATVRSCHFVSDLAEGGPGSPATYLPGRRLAGVAVNETRVRLEIRSRWAAPAHAVAAEIRAAVRPLIGNQTIDVTIGDIDDPPSGWPSKGEHPSAGQPPPHTTGAVADPRRPEACAPRVGPSPAS
jgi:hypothetical protein